LLFKKRIETTDILPKRKSRKNFQTTVNFPFDKRIETTKGLPTRRQNIVETKVRFSVLERT